MDILVLKEDKSVIKVLEDMPDALYTKGDRMVLEIPTEDQRIIDYSIRRNGHTVDPDRLTAVVEMVVREISYLMDVDNKIMEKMITIVPKTRDDEHIVVHLLNPELSEKKFLEFLVKAR